MTDFMVPGQVCVSDSPLIFGSVRGVFFLLRIIGGLDSIPKNWWHKNMSKTEDYML